MPRREGPLGPGDDVVVEFAAGLRRLREEAGGPTYRTLASRAGYSAAALSEAAGGRKLPGLALTTAYVSACGGDVGKWDARWREAAASLAATSTPGPEAETPYLGLTAFQCADAGRYFGREQLIGELTAKLAQRRFVGVFGASGSGKSSLLRAGLAGRRPALVCTPGEHPLTQCADALAGTGRLLVVDQFEEIFTLCADDAERTGFLGALLARAADEHGSQVVVGVRADFYGHCGRHAELVEALRDAQVLVGPMTADELRTAIVEPAVRHGCQVESALVTTLVAEAAGRPAVLPLVSHALLETWRRRQGITLTLAAYEATGGIRNAIAHTAEAVYGEFEPAQQVKARQVFLRLTALGDGTEDTKRRLRRRELDDDPATAEVLERLAAARLLALDREGAEIAHEALIRSWPRLRDWLAEDREGHRLHRRLAEATDLWEALDRDAGSLYRGTRLGLATEWAARSPEALTAREQDFLDAGRAQEAAEAATARRRTRRLRHLVALLGVLLLFAGVATAYAVRATRTATDQRNVALARKAVGDAADLRQANPALSVQLSLAAYRLAQLPETRDSVLGALATPFATRVESPEPLGHDGAVALSGDLMVVAGATRSVRVWSIADPRHPALLATLPPVTKPHYPVALSGDGRILATGTGDNAFRLWDLRDPRRPRSRGVTMMSTDIALTAQISRDGRTLVTAGESGFAELTDISDPDAPRSITALPGSWPPQPQAVKAALSPDGATLAVSNDRDTNLWNVRDPATPVWLSVFSGHTDLVNVPAFSPDGRTLATTGWDDEVRLWDVTDPRAARPLAALPNNGIVWKAAFSPDGRTLATAGDDQVVHLWDIAVPGAPRQLTQLAGHTNSSVWAGYSADGRTLVTAAIDQTVRLYDAPTLELTARAYTPVGFTPDGRTFVAQGIGDLQLWSFTGPDGPRPTGRIGGLPGQVTATALSRDGRSLAIAVLDGTSTAVARGLLLRWDITDPAHPRQVASAAAAKTYSMAFSPDGRTLATGYDNGPLDVWDVSDPGRFAEPVTLPSPYAGTVWSARFTPDGRTLAYSQKSAPSAVYLWDVTDRRHPARITTLDAGAGAAGALAFAPDGRTLAVGSSDRLVRRWDVTDPAHPVALPPLAGHTDDVGSVAFDPSGTRMVTDSPDRTARLWDVSDPRHPAPAGQLVPAVAGIALFGPDGHTVVLTGSQLWETRPDLAADRICRTAAPKITAAEWERYFPELPYTPPCP
ncbi:hypothetical protein [Amycolatopsis sp. cmx-4-68]|uniref:nSTAND1 domain-containing NTPase n=1 Tax=Amycolatopsis sp. cmx-4-68 TaxID=2790938 RepID=UPI00397D788E